jgi:hypothetical protein
MTPGAGFSLDFEVIEYLRPSEKPLVKGVNRRVSFLPVNLHQLFRVFSLYDYFSAALKEPPEYATYQKKITTRSLLYLFVNRVWKLWQAKE